LNTAEVAKKIKQRSKYYVPVTEWLPKYSWDLYVRIVGKDEVVWLKRSGSREI
jgi:hypothetical protein